MPGAAIGALLGFAFSSTIIGWGLAATWMGAVLLGASIGSLFDAPDIDLGRGSTPNYAFGPISNTKSQLLPVPIVYGKCRVGGNIFLQIFETDERQQMDMFVGVSEGPINAILSVAADEHILYGDGGTVYTYWILRPTLEDPGGLPGWEQVTYQEYAEFNGPKEVRDADGNPTTPPLEGVSCDVHLGTPDQAADEREPNENPYPNTAYVAVTLKAQEGLSGNPVITSIVEGRRVWTPTGVRFTRNPAWIVYDFLTNTRYGVGIPTDYIDLPSFTAAASYCDYPIDGEPRFTLDYIIDVQRPAVDHLQAMLGCFRGYFLARDKIELHVEQPGSVYKSLGPDNFVKDSFSWWQKSGDDSPNRITIEWIDPENHYEQSTAPFEWQEDIAARGVFEKSFSLLGVTRPKQVGRLGNYLLETAKRIQNFCAFQVSLQDADIEAGEIVEISHPDFTGWDKKKFRVLAVQDEGQTGTVTITCAEYDAAVYSDDALPVDQPIQETEPIVREDIYALSLEDVGHLNDDGVWVPIVRATWQNPGAFTPSVINVRWRYDGAEEWVMCMSTTSTITKCDITGIQTDKKIDVWVNCVHPKTKRPTAGVIASMTVGKDVTPPDAPTGLTATGWFGSIILEWINPPDPDLHHTEVWENAVDDRETAVKIAEAGGSGYTRYLGSFQGRYYWIRCVDRTGNIGPWNAEEGTYGYSDQEDHQDLVDIILQNELVQEAIKDLNTPVDSLAESGIWNALSDYNDALKENLRQRYQDKLAEAAIQAELGALNDVKFTIATVNEERITREEEDMALASQILTISAMLGDPDNPGEGTVYAALVSERTARVTADEAMAANIDALTAVIGDPWNPGPGTIYAAIKTEQTTRANADEALSSSISTVAASIGDPASPAPGTVYAAVRTEATARANADSALASNVTTLQTKVDGNTNSVQVLSQSVDGIKGKYAVKIDTNGYVTGWELIGGATSGSMIIHVDNLIIGRPGATNQYPFVIGVVDGVQRISLSNAFIQDGSIKNAKIQDLTVGRIKLASGGPGALSWGVTSGYQWPFGGPYGFVDSSERVFRELYIDTTGATHVLVQAYMRSFIYGGNVLYGKLTKNYGSQALGAGGTAWLQSESHMIVNYMDTSPGTGQQLYQVKGWVPSGSGQVVAAAGIMAIAFYR